MMIFFGMMIFSKLTSHTAKNMQKRGKKRKKRKKRRKKKTVPRVRESPAHLAERSPIIADQSPRRSPLFFIII